MASNSFSIHSNTAASLLHYEQYGPGNTLWTRVATANEEFNVASSGGHRFLVRFAANFAKKHLATFSKKVWANEKEAWLQSQQPGQRTDEENWNRAQAQLLENKILKILGARNPMCACGHLQKSTVGQLHTTGHSNAGNCKHAGCPCGGFAPQPSSYVTARANKGKPVTDPLAGAATNQSSCIVLNWIPLNEFQTVVGDSIVAADPGNAMPDTPVNGALTHLTWTFAHRAGAVRHAQNGAVDLNNGTWCRVGAKKSTVGMPLGIVAIWTVVHWDGQG